MAEAHRFQTSLRLNATWLAEFDLGQPC